MVEKKQKQKPMVHNIIIDKDGKCEGMTDFQVGTLDATYHMLEDLCVSAHAITLVRDFMSRLSKQERDEIVRTTKKIVELLPIKNPMLGFVMTHMLFINSYSNLFDAGLSSLFNQIKMDRDGVMFGMQRAKTEQEDTNKKPLEKPSEKTPDKVSRSPEI